jgi:lysophospholipase L1-like esterase
MEFRTIVDIPDPGFRISPCEEMLFVGSCFATEIGHRFQEEKFRAMVNPYGVMYNPASIFHTIQRLSEGVPSDLQSNGNEYKDLQSAKTIFLTLGTNHVYRLKSTNEIVDNCEKRPQSLFTEEELSVEACADYLQQAITLLREQNPAVRIILTVSPIRYRKYGYHASQLSKATLLLAIQKVCVSPCQSVAYFPAYEIVNDELRDYRFYKPDMLHPSDQAVEYIWQRLSETYLSDEAKTFIQEWAPLKAALNHKPFDAESEEYKAFMHKTMLKVEALKEKYPTFAL